MKRLGTSGEELAWRFLKKKGYRIIERNYKTPIGEIDLIANDRGVTVFIEVKTRSSISFGFPFEAVHTKKRQKLRNLALLYLKQKKILSPVRFDVLSIILRNNGDSEIEHLMDAFEV